MILRTVLKIVIYLFPVSEILLALFKRANTRSARVEDRGSLRLLWLVISLSICLAIAFQWVPSADLPLSRHVRRILALCLILAGLAVRWVSILTLGRLFTVDVAIQSGHTLVDTGLYRYIRHPSYSGLLLAFIGLGISFANWLSIVALLLPITLAVYNRIVKEEHVLFESLGASYAAYCARTKRLVPGLL